MSITVVSEGNVLKIVEADGELPAGEKVKLFTTEELTRRSGYSPLECLQLESIFSESDEDWGNSLDSLVVKKHQNP
ncbi:MAG TPA: hypothetical protein DCQ92_10455 [Verrucomicrobia subdivision 3 bacterium]|nr:hypothetical protein [Limisphaerales bacterium]